MDPKRVSKYLSLVLRHEPERIGLSLDAGGWVELAELVANGPAWLTAEAVLKAVAENDKQRFSVVDGRIRANQGHSVAVDLDLKPEVPPNLLYHGTFPGALAAIEVEGLQKMARHHVHLAAETGTATIVGKRSGTPVVLTVRAGEMHRDGHVFFRSVNGVWLTDHVPPRYLGPDPA